MPWNGQSLRSFTGDDSSPGCHLWAATAPAPPAELAAGQRRRTAPRALPLPARDSSAGEAGSAARSAGGCSSPVPAGRSAPARRRAGISRGPLPATRRWPPPLPAAHTHTHTCGAGRGLSAGCGTYPPAAPAPAAGRAMRRVGAPPPASPPRPAAAARPARPAPAAAPAAAPRRGVAPWWARPGAATDPAPRGSGRPRSLPGAVGNLQASFQGTFSSRSGSGPRCRRCPGEPRDCGHRPVAGGRARPRPPGRGFPWDPAVHPQRRGVRGGEGAGGRARPCTGCSNRFSPAAGMEERHCPPAPSFLPDTGLPLLPAAGGGRLAKGTARLIPGVLLSCRGGGWRLSRLIHRARFVMLSLPLPGSPSPRVLCLHSAVWRLVFPISSSLPNLKVLYSFNFKIIKRCLLYWSISWIVFVGNKHIKLAILDRQCISCRFFFPLEKTGGGFGGGGVMCGHKRKITLPWLCLS